MNNQGYIKNSIHIPAVPKNHYLCEVPTLNKDVRVIFRREEAVLGSSESEKFDLVIQDKETIINFVNLNPEYRKALALWLLGDIR